MDSCACLNFSSADPIVQRYGLGAAAMRYQNRGYAVVPLVRGGKKPHRMLPWSPEVPSGVHHATDYPASAMHWWEQDKAANVGVATGSKSRLAVIDLDVKRGQDGPAVFWRFLFENGLGELPGVPTVRTPSGGLHLWLRTPAGQAVPERPGILPGVDAKGDGGLVVAPPSMILALGLDRPHERGAGEAPVPYVWTSGCPCQVPAAPPWLLPWLQTAPSTGSPGGSGSVRENNEDGPGLASLKDTGIPRGQRNATLYRLACSLFRTRGMSVEACVAVKEDLMQVWQASDRTGMSPSEVLTIIDSARRFIAGQVEAEEAQARQYVQWMDRGRRSP
jgi:Bifunctional DNA primase/polymerase, N-terminal/Primase C terminal 1 (PriCT-1)